MSVSCNSHVMNIKRFKPNNSMCPCKKVNPNDLKQKVSCFSCAFIFCKWIFALSHFPIHLICVVPLSPNINIQYSNEIGKLDWDFRVFPKKEDIMISTFLLVLVEPWFFSPFLSKCYCIATAFVNFDKCATRWKACVIKTPRTRLHSRRWHNGKCSRFVWWRLPSCWVSAWQEQCARLEAFGSSIHW